MLKHTLRITDFLFGARGLSSMKSHIVFVAIAVIVAISLVSGRLRAARPSPTLMDDGGAPAPKKQEKSAAKADGPLLLEDDDSSEDTSKGADNSRCFVCHLNMKTEQLAATHAGAKVGCAKCHGASDAHIADESWASGGNGTAPDKMFPRDKINAFCQTCHDMSTPSSDTKCEFPTLSEADAKAKVCTDCHGKHRLATRKCKWK